MNKHLFAFLFIIIIALNTKAQENKFQISKISVQNGSKDQLYIRAKTWITNYFNSAKDVIQLDDKSSGKIILQAAISARYTDPNKPASVCEDGDLYFTLSIDIKPNKSRINIYDIRHEGMNLSCDIGGKADFDYGSLNDNRPNEPAYESIKKNAKIDFAKMISNIESSLKFNKKTDNW